MYQAKKRFNISILDYTITSNHIHLLVKCDEDENTISGTMHLVSGCIAREYNTRKNRSGSFWGDRYGGVAVETDVHLHRCMIYIATNMVRAGVVQHPREWKHCGYQEHIGHKKRFTLIDKKHLLQILQLDEISFLDMYISCIEEYLNLKKFQRESCWTESIAVGTQDFVRDVKKSLGYRAKGRKISKESDFYQLKEPKKSYLRIPPKKESKSLNHS
jgi:putative transposase